MEEREGGGARREEERWRSEREEGRGEKRKGGVRGKRGEERRGSVEEREGGVRDGGWSSKVVAVKGTDERQRRKGGRVKVHSRVTFQKKCLYSPQLLPFLQKESERSL